jgi:hypothetical protein
MVDVWAVIGGPKMHKSSSIRALTGVRKIEPKWGIAYDKHRNACTYVHPSGLQEVKKSKQTFIQDVCAAGVNYVIVALRYEAQFSNAVEYLTAFKEAGWNIAGYTVLGSCALLPFDGGVRIPNARNMASNEIAAQLRQAWGIV